MGLFLNPNQKLFSEYYNRYETLYQEYKELYDDVVPRNMRLFDIRYRISLCVTPSFDNHFGNMMTDSIKTTYKLMIKMNDIWFAYEALYKLCVEDEIVKSSTVITNPFTEDTIEELGLDMAFNNLVQYMHPNLLMNSRRKIDLMSFLDYLKKDKKQVILSALSSARLNVDQNKPLKLKEVLSVIFAMLHNYMHEGDTARSGVQYYSTKIHLLKPFFDFFVIYNLRVMMYILEKKIKEIEPDEN